MYIRVTCSSQPDGVDAIALRPQTVLSEVPRPSRTRTEPGSPTCPCPPPLLSQTTVEPLRVSPPKAVARSFPGSADPRDAGIVLGRSPRHAGRALLIDDSDHHVLVATPPGGGKTTGPILGTLLTNTRDSAFVLDPKAELWTVSAGWRHYNGHCCLRFAPATGNGLPWNLFDEIPKGHEEIRPSASSPRA